MKKMTIEEAQEILNTFTDKIKTLTLATVSESGEPFSSYAPYVEDEEGNYYAVLSAIVPHAKNMANTKKAHIMFIEDEGDSFDMYARRRLYFEADVEKFEENDSRTEEIGKLFLDKFGKTAKMLLGWPDFRIYKMIPKNGNIVLGFGAAYAMDENRQILKQNTGEDKGGTSGAHPHGYAHEKNI